MTIKEIKHQNKSALRFERFMQDRADRNDKSELRIGMPVMADDGIVYHVSYREYQSVWEVLIIWVV